MSGLPILAIELRTEHDVVLARQRARRVAALLGLEAQDQTRLAVAVSEIARNAFQHGGGGGRVELLVDRGERGGAAALLVRVADRGRGIADVDAVLEGRAEAPAGRGFGISGARRLADHFEIASAPGGGTTVTLGMRLPARAPAAARDIGRLGALLAGESPQSAFEELRLQNQELLRALEELRLRQAEVERLNRELEETNRGVVALYAELDERAGWLERASEAKSRFLSHLSHELRTPLNAIRNLTRLLLDGFEGALTERQERPVRLIRASADGLTEMVEELLDLARIEAGKTSVRAEPFTVDALFATLRGMFRPLVSGEAVALVIEEPDAALPPLVTDEAKVAQILRNLVSNAVKFTDRGEVRVRAAVEGELVTFTVRDTGVGIAAADQERIFEPWVQVEGAHQHAVKGTGLGLPLSRELARLLGGSLTVESAPGAGATFTLTIPRRAPAPAPDARDPHGAAREVRPADAPEAARHG